MKLIILLLNHFLIKLINLLLNHYLIKLITSHFSAKMSVLRLQGTLENGSESAMLSANMKIQIKYEIQIKISFWENSEKPICLEKSSCSYTLTYKTACPIENSYGLDFRILVPEAYKA